MPNYIKKEDAQVKNHENLPYTEFRLRILGGVIISSIPVIIPSLCNNVIARIQSLISSLLNMEDMTY